MEAVSRILGVTPMFVTVGAAVVLLVTRDPRFLLVLLASELLNPLLKRACAAVLPAWVVDRPSDGGAFGCSQLGGAPSRVVGRGFPSGHAQAMGVLLGYASAARWRGVGWYAALAGAVGVQRVAVGCHSPLQVVAGLATGVGIGLAFAPPT